MKKRLIFLLLVVIPLFACSKVEDDVIQDYLSQNEVDLLNTGLTLLSITTENGEQPTCEFVSAPVGSMGRGITNATKVKGRLVIRRNRQTLYDSGDYSEGVSGIIIKIRGNSSAYTEKKPYKIQLQKKEDLLFRGEDYKDKSWVLIKDCEAMTLKDDMSLRPLIGGIIAELVGMEYVPQGRYVNVLINDDYKGIYFLCENVKRNEKCRVDISKDNGYIFELDPYWWNEDVYFDTGHTSNSYRFTFKEPDTDELSEEKIAYIKNAMLDFEQSLLDETYPFFMDVSSFAKWILAHDIMGTIDAGGVNKYFYKKDNTPNTLITMGPLWDFDGIMKAGESFPTIHTSENHNVYFTPLFKSSFFLNCYSEEWSNLSPTFVDDLYKALDDYTDSEGISLDKSREYEYENLGVEYKSVEENISFAKEYFSHRYVWLLKAIDDLCSNTTDIPAQSIGPKSSKLYGINGQVKNDRNGMFIEKGKIYITK